MPNADFPGTSTQTWIPFFLGTALPPGTAAPGTGIVALMESVGYPASATRMALSRLCTEGLLQRQRHGRTAKYRLSADMSTTITAMHERVAQFGRNVVWSGSWTLVLVSIPDELRSTRRKMHAQLTYLGFGRLREAVWIAARDCADEVDQLTESLHAHEMVDVFLASPAAFTQTAEILSRCWDMDSLVARYRSFEDRFAPLKRASARRRFTPDESVRRWMQLTYDYEEMVARDPELPPEFLPVPIRSLRARVVGLWAAIAPDLSATAIAHARELLTDS